MQILCEGNFELRPFAAGDGPAFVNAVLESQATVGKWMPWAHAEYCLSDALSWFERCDSAVASGSGYEFGVFCAQSGAFLGGTGLNQFNKVNNYCNLGYWVRQSAQGRGAATAATRALVRFAFGSLGVTRVEVVVAEGNLASVAVAERAGGTRECLAANRLFIKGVPVNAHVFSFVPQAED